MVITIGDKGSDSSDQGGGEYTTIELYTRIFLACPVIISHQSPLPI